MTDTGDRQGNAPGYSGRWMGLPEWAVSRQDAAKRLGIHVMTLDRAIKRGEIVAVRYCSRTMVPVWELLRLLAVPDSEVRRHLSSAEAWLADRADR